jgi:hypothetical protein
MKLPNIRQGTAATALLCAALTAHGCASSAPEPSTPGWTAEDSDRLVALHERHRLPGLEDRRFGYDAYWEAVLPTISENPIFRVDTAGTSAEGRAIRRVSFGEGPVPVLLWSQMHGNESTASMALADLFSFLGSEPDHPLATTLGQALTLHLIPMLNPDGAERFQRRNAQGVDVNRDARALVTPEARALKDTRDQVEPAFAFNLHDQGIGTRVGNTDRGAAIALLSPPAGPSREVNDVRRAAIEVAGVIRQAVNPLVPGHVARYDDTFEPRAFGDLITQWGASTILVETGGWAGDPQKQYLRQVNFVGILAALESIASGRHEGVPQTVYTSLPMNGRRIADLKLSGGTLVIPGLPPLRADVLVGYADNLARTGGSISDIGDLAETEAMDTVDLAGRFLHPFGPALDAADGGQLQPGAPAHFRITADEAGNRLLWVLDGGAPPEGVGGR